MLNNKQLRFIDEYMIDLNATRAYKAIYSCKSDSSARAASSKLLTNINVKTEIERRKKELNNKYKMTSEDILKTIVKMLKPNQTEFSQIKEKEVEYYELDEITKKPIKKTKKVKVVDVTETDKLTDDQKIAIASIEQNKYGIKVNLYDKLKLIEMYGKMTGMLDDHEQEYKGIDTGVLKDLSTDELKKLINEAGDKK